MSYKVEELLALRDSVSESAVSLDKFADEDVIKEHVLRPCASATLASAASNQSLRVSVSPALAPGDPNKKPSPSPSIKRGKAERLLKEHGSPPGMRVTAGGRVVPSDLPPLNNSRFDNNTYKPPSVRVIPFDSTMATQPRSESGNVPRLEVVGTQPVLFVGDRAYALPALDATNSMLPPVVPGGLHAASKTVPPLPVLSAKSSFTGASLPPARNNAQTPLVGLDLSTMKAQQTMKKQELRTVEQTEVLQASHQTDAWRAGVIEKKRNLIIELDTLRRQITNIEATDNNVQPAQCNDFSQSVGSAATSMPPPALPAFPQPMPTSMYGFPGTTPFPQMVMYQPAFGGFSNLPVPESAPFAPNLVQRTQSPGSAARRSHAIAIKQPHDDDKKLVNSRLDPKSPTYEPVVNATTAGDYASNTVLSVKRSPWRGDAASQPDRHEGRAISQKVSMSSIDTTDFFPTNTHEHSSTRIAPKVQGSSNEDATVPSTPEKNWPASPWNEGHSGRSSNKAVAKLTSWPEAFGKQPSVGSLRQAATTQPPEMFGKHSSPGSLRQTVSTQPPATVQERDRLTMGAPLRLAFSGNTSAQRTAELRSATEEYWPLVSSKPLTHVPSTYQEGYQAGYDHVGTPDSPEVLNGYIQGLLQFLSDETMKGRSNSLRGLVASSTPHDSAVSMSFNRSDVPFGNQENIRSGRLEPSLETRQASVYGQREDATATHTLSPNNARDPRGARDPRMRNPSTTMYHASMNGQGNTANTYRQAALPCTDNDADKSIVDPGSVSYKDSYLSSNDLPQQFSESQLNSHACGTPVSRQRYYPVAKTYGKKGFGAEYSSFARPMGNQRLSGLDGAMDDLADVALDLYIDAQHPTAEGQRAVEEQRLPESRRSTEGARSAKARGTTEVSEGDASCFGPSSSKGKQKMASSPTHYPAGDRGEEPAGSPVNTSGSPKKSGEHSPAKAKLEQVTNRFRRARKDDPRNMSSEEKKQRSQKWHNRFQRLRKDEMKDIEDHVSNNPRK